MSRERRFFVPDVAAASVELSGDEAHHLIHVVRLRQGDVVVVFDGKGRAASASVARICGDVAALDIGEALPANESPLELTLAVAVPKGDTMSLIVQKLTELGVTTIQPLVSGHSETPADAIEKRLERWRRISLEAAKQCGRARLPNIEPPGRFEELAHRGALMLTPGAPPLPASLTFTSGFVLLVGPEGGWSTSELELADDRELRVFGLGPRTMRTETAAIAGATLVQWLGGDLS